MSVGVSACACAENNQSFNHFLNAYLSSSRTDGFQFGCSSNMLSTCEYVIYRVTGCGGKRTINSEHDTCFSYVFNGTVHAATVQLSLSSFLISLFSRPTMSAQCPVYLFRKQDGGHGD